MGHEFLDEVLTMLSSIAETPLVYPNVHRNTRRAVIHRFPFGVYFRVEDATIVVVAIMHVVEIHVAGRVAHNQPIKPMPKSGAAYGQRYVSRTVVTLGYRHG